MREVGKQGFTLIEVVVAMAILGVGLVIIIELFSGGLRLGRTSEEYTRAVEFARLKMEEMSVAETIAEGLTEGEFEGDYRWQVEVRKVDLLPAIDKTTDFKLPVEHYQILVSVLWKSGSRTRSAGLELYKTVKTVESEIKG
jgi:general secretion pathway protein I